MVDFNKVYLSPNEKDPVKQDGVVRQIIEYLRSTATGAFYAVNGPNIIRLADRLFVGEAASKFAGNDPENGTSWLSDSSTSGGPAFTATNSVLLVTTSGTTTLEHEAIAITGGAKGTNPIGVAGVAEMSTSVSSGNAWAFYGDLTYNPGASQAYGIELAIKNASGVNVVPFPHTQGGGAHGVWLAGGSDNAYGPPSTNPSASAISIIKNSNTWNCGIRIMQDALADPLGAMKISSLSSHAITWWDGSGNLHGYIKSNQTSRNFNIVMSDAQVSIGENTGFLISDPASSKNNLAVTGATSGNAPSLSAQGSDATIDLNLVTKGSSGLVSFGSFTSSTTTNVGYITVKDSAGNVRKLMVGN